MNNKTIANVVMTVMMLVMLTGCGGQSQDYSKSESAEVTDNAFMSKVQSGTVSQITEYSPEADEEYGNADVDGGNAPQSGALQISSNKIIYKGELSLGTGDVTKLQDNIIKEVGSVGGYVQSSYTERDYVDIVVRVPQGKFFSFMDSEIFKAEEIDRKNISSEDVTLQYSNMEAELESLRVQEERLLTYLKSAKDVKDMLEIENQLARTRLSIKTAEETKKAMDSYISMPEVNINIYSRANSVQIASLGSRIGYAFENAGHQIKNNFDNFIVGCIQFIPALINLAILAVIVVLIIRQRHRLARVGNRIADTRKKNREKDGNNDK